MPNNNEKKWQKQYIVYLYFNIQSVCVCVYMGLVCRHTSTLSLLYCLISPNWWVNQRVVIFLFRLKRKVCVVSLWNQSWSNKTKRHRSHVSLDEGRIGWHNQGTTIWTWHYTTHIDRILTHKTFVLYMLTKRTFIGLVPRSIKPRFFNINQRQWYMPVLTR